MRKLAKAIGFIAAAAAILWAMRDRFISVTTSREPEIPAFRAVRPKPRQAGVDTVNGIGPVFAARLKEAGLGDIRALASASSDRVAEAAGVSAARARSWIEQAQAQT